MKQAIQQLIAESKTKQAIEALLNAVGQDNDLKNTVLQLSARFSELEKRIHGGIIAADEASLERNKITAALLHILGSLGSAGVEVGKAGLEGSAGFQNPPNLGTTQHAEKIYNIQHIDKADFS